MVYLTQNAPELILEHLNFPGGHAPDPPLDWAGYAHPLVSASHLKTSSYATVYLLCSF